MSDWLNMDEGNGDGGFLSLDDPAAPTAPGLAAPDPFHGGAEAQSNAAGGDWLGISGDEQPADAGWLGDDAAPAPAQEQQWSEQPAASDPWMSTEQAPAPMAQPHHLVQSAPAQAAPAQWAAANELTIEAPFLEQMAPGVPSLGGITSGDLSSVVLDVEVPVEVFFGDASLTVEQFLELDRGAVIELDHAIEAPIELRVRDKVVARGQLVSINGNYGLRVTDIIEGIR